MPTALTSSSPFCLDGHFPTHWELAANKLFQYVRHFNKCSWNLAPLLRWKMSNLKLCLCVFFFFFCNKRSANFIILLWSQLTGKLLITEFAEETEAFYNNDTSDSRQFFRACLVQFIEPLSLIVTVLLSRPQSRECKCQRVYWLRPYTESRSKHLSLHTLELSRELLNFPKSRGVPSVNKGREEEGRKYNCHYYWGGDALLVRQQCKLFRPWIVIDSL